MYIFFHFLLSRQEYAKGISFITIKQRHYESNAFCKVKSDNLAENDQQKNEFFLNACSNLYGSLSQFEIILQLCLNQGFKNMKRFIISLNYWVTNSINKLWCKK